MATIVAVAGTASTTGGQTLASAAFTPSAGDLLVVFLFASGSVTVPTMSSSIAGVTFSSITSALARTSADTLTLFIANNFTTSASQTVTSGNMGAGCTGAIIMILQVTGMLRTGKDGIRQTAIQSNQAAAGTPTPVFGVACLTGNPTIGAVGNATSPATMTPPTNWTEGTDVGYSTPTTGGEDIFRNSGFTGTSMPWGGTSASAFGDIGAELDTSTAVTGIQTREVGSGADQPKIEKVQIINY